MLKIFLVEDEYVVREGIKNNIDWKAHGYEFCGEASDGELALPMIQKERPDIVITDIKMPFMDGLVLSRLIKKEIPWTEIILLTGHEKFEYAQEAIKIGIARYLSKPIGGRELLQEIDALAVRIEEKRHEREIAAQYRKEMEETFREERKDLFGYLVTGDKSAAQLLDMADRLGIDLSAMWYNIILLQIKSKHHTQDEYSSSLIELEQKLMKLNDENGLLTFDRNLEGKAMLLRAESKEALLTMQEGYLASVRQLAEGYAHIRYFGGVGMPVNRLTDIPDSFETASHAFAHRFLVSESMLLSGEELNDSGMEKDDFQLGSVNPKQFDREKIREFLKTGEQGETVYFVEEFFKALGQNAARSKVFMQYLIMDVYFCVVEFLDSLQLEREQISPPDMGNDSIKKEEAARSYLTSVLRQAIALRESRASNRYGDIVEAAIHYIEENYADEELSLNTLAAHVNFSPNHLSMVFSQQTGQNFIKYLTEYRMSRAKELLRCTGKRSSEISLEVGYKDPHYFSYLFKKTQGMTPTQYRSGKRPEGEE